MIEFAILACYGDNFFVRWIQTRMNERLQLDFLTGMRGYAALGVVLFHIFAIFTPNIHPAVMDILILGPKGVIVFFVLSAFTIALSLDGRQSEWCSYAVRRFFRIAPAYYLMLVIVLFGRESSFAAQFNTPFELRSFIFHLSFLNWIDFRHANNALGVEWTLSIEALYYILLPTFIWISRTGLGAVLLIVVSVGFHLLTPAPPVTEPWQWSPLPYAICFATGVIAYKYWSAISEWRVFKSGVVLIVVLMAAILIRPVFSFPMTIVWWTVVTCALLFSGRSVISEYIFANRIALWFGERSYSLYLVHLPLLVMIIRKQHGVIGAIVTLALSLVAAYCLHRWIEKPGVSLGRILVQRASRMAEVGSQQSR
nr:acyltransferase [Agrobacterium sp. AGB01]